MNLRELADLIEAWRARRSRGRDGLLAALDAADASLGGAQWSASVPADPSEPGLTLIARALHSRPRLGPLAEVVGLGALDAAGPDAGEVAARLTWDGAKGGWRRARLYGAVRGARRPFIELRAGVPLQVREARSLAFSRARFASAELARSLRLFSQRCPVAAVETERSAAAAGESWRLSLREPEPWPRFLRLDAAAPFWANAAELSLALAGRSLRALAWEGQDAWADLAP